MESVYILGKDRRFDALERLCRDEGFFVFRSVEKKEKGVFIFSLGAKKEEILSFLEKAEMGSLFLVGRADKETKELARKAGIGLFCLLEENEYLEKNSTATAEGTLAEVIRRTDRVLGETSVLICGYGNCGRALARLFWLCGSEVWIFSHEGSMEKARKDGFNTYRAPGKNLGMFDVILNTVPEALFSSEWVQGVREDGLIFQIATGLSGMDPDFAALGIPFIPLPSLPAKYAPETEAETIFTLLKRLLYTKKESE